MKNNKKTSAFGFIFTVVLTAGTMAAADDSLSRLGAAARQLQGMSGEPAAQPLPSPEPVEAFPVPGAYLCKVQLDGVDSMLGAPNPAAFHYALTSAACTLRQPFSREPGLDNELELTLKVVRRGGADRLEAASVMGTPLRTQPAPRGVGVTFETRGERLDAKEAVTGAIACRPASARYLLIPVSPNAQVCDYHNLPGTVDEVGRQMKNYTGDPLEDGLAPNLLTVPLTWCVGGDSQAAYEDLKNSPYFNKQKNLRLEADGSLSWRRDTADCLEWVDDNEDCVKEDRHPDSTVVRVPRCGRP